jgi:hypothetical protein
MRLTEPPTTAPPKTYEQGLGERRAANLPISATWCRTPGTHADCEGDVGEVAVRGGSSAFESLTVDAGAPEPRC